jgi:hypothetical protein
MIGFIKMIMNNEKLIDKVTYDGVNFEIVECAQEVEHHHYKTGAMYAYIPVIKVY